MKVAIFDFDQTLTNAFVSVELMMELEKHKIIRPGYIKFMENLLEGYKNKTISYNDGANQEFVQRAINLDGVSVLKFQQFVENDFKVERFINSWVKELFDLLHSKGYLIVVISGAMEAFLEVAQEKLGFDSYFGSRVGILEGKYTNSPDLFMNDEEKSRILKQLTKDSDMTLGFGDSTGDVKMLELMDFGFLYQPKEEAILAIQGKSNISIVDEKSIIEAVKKVA